MPNALTIVRSYFPKVTKVRDADQNISIEVIKGDVNSAIVRNHNKCALAVACKRAFKCDGVIVAIGTVYLIKGEEAIRFKVPESISREISIFDRGGKFDVGVYNLIAPAKSQRLGAIRPGNTHSSDPDKQHSGNLKKKFVHFTNGIRVALGSTVAPDGIRLTHPA